MEYAVQMARLRMHSTVVVGLVGIREGTGPCSKLRSVIHTQAARLPNSHSYTRCLLTLTPYTDQSQRPCLVKSPTKIPCTQLFPFDSTSATLHYPEWSVVWEPRIRRREQYSIDQVPPYNPSLCCPPLVREHLPVPMLACMHACARAPSHGRCVPSTGGECTR